MMSTDTADVGLTTAAVRAITRVDSEKYGLSAQIAQGLAAAIRVGLIPDGERLPPETQLSQQLSVSTVTLREALSALRGQGLVITLRELGDHRSAISGTVARLAAQRALPEEIGRLHRKLERLRVADSPGSGRRADTQLTIEVALAAQSARLTMEELRLRAEVGDLLWVQLTREDRATAVTARTRLVEAIENREPERARELAELHVAEETRRLLRWRLGLHGLLANAEMRGGAQ
jgi:DNA-binding FadR family transcriptional regulator